MIHSFIHSFHKYLFFTPYDLDTMRGTGSTAVNKVVVFPALVLFILLQATQTINMKTKKHNYYGLRLEN